MRKIILLTCYIVWVSEEYQLTVCEINPPKEEHIIEVTEGDGYKSVTYDDLNIAIQDTIFKD